MINKVPYSNYFSGSIYVVGGSGLMTVEYYEPGRNVWTNLPNMLSVRGAPGKIDIVVCANQVYVDGEYICMAVMQFTVK